MEIKTPCALSLKKCMPFSKLEIHWYFKLYISNSLNDIIISTSYVNNNGNINYHLLLSVISSCNCYSLLKIYMYIDWLLSVPGTVPCSFYVIHSLFFTTLWSRYYYCLCFKILERLSHIPLSHNTITQSRLMPKPVLVNSR